MPSFHPLQESFAAGEISPLLRGRVSIEGYKSGCQILENFIPDSRGPALGRGGFEHIATADVDTGRLFHLQIAEDAFAVGLLTDTNLSLFNADGSPMAEDQITEGDFGNGGAAWNETVSDQNSTVTYAKNSCVLDAREQGSSLVTNGNFANLGTGWTERNDGASTVAFAAGSCTLTPNQLGGVNPRWAGIAQQLTTPSPNTEHVILLQGDFDLGSAVINIGTVNGDGTYLSATLGQNDSLTFTPTASPFWIAIDCEKPDIELQLNLVEVYAASPGFARTSQGLTGLTAGDHYLHVNINRPGNLNIRVGTGDNDGTYLDQLVTGDSFTLVLNIPATTATVSFHVDSTDTVDINSVTLASVSDQFSVNTPWPEDILHEIHLVDFPGGEEIHFLHPNHPPQRLKYTAGSFTFSAVPNTNFPSEWTGSNYPRTGTYLWGRLWYAGTPNEPQTFWGSKPAQPYNFDVPVSGGTAEDAISYTIQKFGRIRWMEGTKALLIGTEYAEYVVVSESRFADISEPPDIQQQSAYGSNYVQPIQIGDQVAYVSPDGKKVRVMQYEWSADNWLSQDLTFFSEHITRSGIKYIGWHQNPYNLLWCILNNGEMAVLSYQRDQNVWGWGRFVESGTILSATSPTVNGDHFFVRLSGLVPGRIDLEYESWHRSGFVDHGVRKVETVAFTTVDGLDHLEGRTVRVLVDDIDNPSKTTDMLAVHPDRVVSGGQITLQAPATEAVVGVGYTPRLVTLPLEVPTREGTQIFFQKTYPEIYVAVKDSFGITINGHRPPDRRPQTPMNTREPDRTYLVRVSDNDWNEDGSITVEQELSLPVEVLYIASKAQLEHV
jgi:hypothetical protein